MDLSNDNSSNPNPDSSVDEGRSHFLETLGAGDEALSSLRKLREISMPHDEGVVLSSEENEISLPGQSEEKRSHPVQVQLPNSRIHTEGETDSAAADAEAEASAKLETLPEAQEISVETKTDNTDSAPAADTPAIETTFEKTPEIEAIKVETPVAVTPATETVEVESPAPIEQITLACPKCHGELILMRQHLGIEGNCVWCQTPIVAAASGTNGDVKIFPILAESEALASAPPQEVSKVADTAATISDPVQETKEETIEEPEAHAAPEVGIESEITPAPAFAPTNPDPIDKALPGFAPLEGVPKETDSASEIISDHLPEDVEKTEILPDAVASSEIEQPAIEEKPAALDQPETAPTTKFSSPLEDHSPLNSIPTGFDSPTPSPLSAPPVNEAAPVDSLVDSAAPAGFTPEAPVDVEGTPEEALTLNGFLSPTPTMEPDPTPAGDEVPAASAPDTHSQFSSKAAPVAETETEEIPSGFNAPEPWGAPQTDPPVEKEPSLEPNPAAIDFSPETEVTAPSAEAPTTSEPWAALPPMPSTPEEPTIEPPADNAPPSESTSIDFSPPEAGDNTSDLNSLFAPMPSTPEEPTIEPPADNAPPSESTSIDFSPPEAGDNTSDLNSLFAPMPSTPEEPTIEPPADNAPPSESTSIDFSPPEAGDNTSDLNSLFAPLPSTPEEPTIEPPADNAPPSESTSIDFSPPEAGDNTSDLNSLFAPMPTAEESPTVESEATLIQPEVAPAAEFVPPGGPDNTSKDTSNSPAVDETNGLSGFHVPDTEQGANNFGSLEMSSSAVAATLPAPQSENAAPETEFASSFGSPTPEPEQEEKAKTSLGINLLNPAEDSSSGSTPPSNSPFASLSDAPQTATMEEPAVETQAEPKLPPPIPESSVPTNTIPEPEGPRVESKPLGAAAPKKKARKRFVVFLVILVGFVCGGALATFVLPVDEYVAAGRSYMEAKFGIEGSASSGILSLPSAINPDAQPENPPAN